MKNIITLVNDLEHLPEPLRALGIDLFNVKCKEVDPNHECDGCVFEMEEMYDSNSSCKLGLLNLEQEIHDYFGLECSADDIIYTLK